MKSKPKASRNGRKPGSAHHGMIDFHFGETLYQIDPNRRKVYHRWVEVETVKTFRIMGAYSQSQARAD